SPFPHTSRAWQWVDGLQGCELLMPVLRRFDNVDVLHGHFHYAVERPIDTARSRVFGTTAVVEDSDSAPRFRLHGDHGIRESLLHVIERFDAALTALEHATIFAATKEELERIARVLRPHIREVEARCGARRR